MNFEHRLRSVFAAREAVRRKQQELREVKEAAANMEYDLLQCLIAENMDWAVKIDWRALLATYGEEEK